MGSLPLGYDYACCHLRADWRVLGYVARPTLDLRLSEIHMKMCDCFHLLQITSSAVYILHIGLIATFAASGEIVTTSSHNSYRLVSSCLPSQFWNTWFYTFVWSI